MGFFVDSKIEKNLRVVKAQFKDFPLGKDKLPDFKIELVPDDISLYTLTPVKNINEYSFYETDDGFLFSMENTFLRLNKDATVAKIYCPEEKTYEKQFNMGYLLLLAYKYAMIAKGGFIIHSATSVYKDSCICFCGLSGAGKSTQTSLWKKHMKTWSLNFDQPCIYSEDGRYFAHGSPWSGKERLFRNCYCPVKAIVFVQQAKENSVQRLSKAEAFSLLYLNNYIYPVSHEFEHQYIENIKNTISSVPVYRLNCTISEEAVEVLYNELYNNDYNTEKKVANMKYSTKKNFEMKEIAGDFILIPRGSDAVNYSAVLVLNDTGAFLWKEMHSPVTISELTDKLVAKFSPDIEQARKDVETFIDKMCENELLDVHEE